MPAPPKTANHSIEKTVGTMITPKQNSRMVRPREMRATKMPMNGPHRSEEHTSELQSLMRLSHAVFCLKKQKQYQLVRHVGSKKLKHLSGYTCYKNRRKGNQSISTHEAKTI